jgi:hypothetical protein
MAFVIMPSAATLSAGLMLSNAAASTEMTGTHFNMPPLLLSALPVLPGLPPSTSLTSIKVKTKRLFHFILALSRLATILKLSPAPLSLYQTLRFR